MHTSSYLNLSYNNFNMLKTTFHRLKRMNAATKLEIKFSPYFICFKYYVSISNTISTFLYISFLLNIHLNLSLSLTFQLSHTPTNINNKKESKHGSECNTKTWCCEMGFRSLFLYPNNKSCAVRVRVSTQSLLTQCKI